MVSVDSFSPAELEWIDQLVAELPAGVVEGGVETLSNYFARQRQDWGRLEADQRPNPETVINAVAAAIGNELVRELGLKWVVVSSDDEGTRAALYSKRGEVLLYPMEAVAKRWSSDASGSIEAYYKGVVQQARSFSA